MERAVELGLCAPHPGVLHVAVEVARDVAWVGAQLFEQLVCLHQIDERFETLALLVDFLVLASVKKIFLDFLKQKVLVIHDVVVIIVGFLVLVSIIFITAVLFLNNEEAIDELFERALVVLRVLLVVLRAHLAKLLLHVRQNGLEANQVGHDWQLF